MSALVLSMAAKDRGAEFAVFKSGFAPDPFLTFGDKSRRTLGVPQELMAFNNLRSQVAYMFGNGVDNKVKILELIPR